VFRHCTALIGPILLVALCAAPPCTPGNPAIVTFEPHAAEGAPPIHGETWDLSTAGYSIRLQQLDEEERQAYIKKVTGLPTDPFAGRPDVPPRFLSFLLEIENRLPGAIDLNPLNCWLMTNKKQIETPIGMTDLSFDYRMAGADMPPAYETVNAVILSHHTVVESNNSMHGLLVYRALKPKTKSYTVEIQVTLPDGNVSKMTAPYRRAKQSD
jgi:hypothetical protein